MIASMTQKVEVGLLIDWVGLRTLVLLVVVGLAVVAVIRLDVGFAFVVGWEDG